jgi:hypothetical protein
VALIEALVALAVVGFGMLAVVGSIGTLRLNGDVSRQRSEALRIGQDLIEEWRGFSVLAPVAGNTRTAFADIVTGDAFQVTGANATYTVRRRVSEDAEVPGTIRPDRRHVLVTLTWNDRIGEPQEVRLSTTIERVDPALRGAGVAAPAGILSRPSYGRSAVVPPGARQIPEGRSVLVPPGQPVGDRVVLVFNNATGVVTRCVTGAQTTDTVVVADLNDTNCGTDQYLLMQGFIRFYLTPAATAAQRAVDMRAAADTPPVTPTVAVERTEPLDGTDTCITSTVANVVEYYCVVYTFDVPRWSGTLVVGLPGLTIGSGDSDFRVCRFFPVTRIDAGKSIQETVVTNLLNQNLVVTTGANTVPTAGCNINITTAPAPPRVWHHQPAA